MIWFIVVFICLILLAIGSKIDWKKLALKKWGNNISRAYVYIDEYNHVSKYEAKEDIKERTDKSITYRYKINGERVYTTIPLSYIEDIKNENNEIIDHKVIQGYPVKWVDGHRVIMITNNELINPFANKDLINFKIDILGEELIQAKAVKQAIMSIKGNEINWTLIAICGICLIGGIIVYKMLFPTPTATPLPSGSPLPSGILPLTPIVPTTPIPQNIPHVELIRLILGV